MPVYQLSPIQRKVQQAVPGVPAYALGSLNYIVAPTKGNVVQVALASPTATVRLLVKEGQVPYVGQLISFQGVVPAYFNVVNASILTVSQVNTPDDGTYDITFTLTNSNIGTTLSPGRFDAPQTEIGDSVVLGGTGTWASAAIAIQMNTGPNDGRSVRFDVSAPGVSGSVLVVAQSADLDIDSEYQDLATILQVTGGVPAGGAIVVSQTLQRFVRFSVRNIVGVTGTLIGKVEV